MFRFETIQIFIIVHFRKRIKKRKKRKRKKEKYLLLGRSQAAHEVALCGRVCALPLAGGDDDSYLAPVSVRY
jgi:hypothetical protein